MQNKISIHRIAAIGMITALVFVSNYVQFFISTPFGANTRIHIANGICLLAALLFGEYGGGIAAGLGSFLYDLTNPAYAATSWVTFLLKFLLAFICGFVVYGNKKDMNKPVSFKRKLLGTAVGSLSYVVIYVAKLYIEQCLILGLEVETVMMAVLTINLPISLINACLAIPISMLIYSAISPALKKSGLSERMNLR